MALIDRIIHAYDLVEQFSPEIAEANRRLKNARARNTAVIDDHAYAEAYTMILGHLSRNPHILNLRVSQQLKSVMQECAEHVKIVSHDPRPRSRR